MVTCRLPVVAAVGAQFVHGFSGKCGVGGVVVGEYDLLLHRMVQDGNEKRGWVVSTGGGGQQVTASAGCPQTVGTLRTGRNRAICRPPASINVTGTPTNAPRSCPRTEPLIIGSGSGAESAAITGIFTIGLGSGPSTEPLVTGSGSGAVTIQSPVN
jgi:hypothetical protein